VEFAGHSFSTAADPARCSVTELRLRVGGVPGFDLDLLFTAAERTAFAALPAAGAEREFLLAARELLLGQFAKMGASFAFVSNVYFTGGRVELGADTSCGVGASAKSNLQNSSGLRSATIGDVEF